MNRPFASFLRRACASGAFIALTASGTALAATITIVNDDASGQGFNDATAAAPIGGNAGTTRGAQALNAFEYAAGVLGALIYSDVEITVQARFAPSPALDCASSWAVLGGASPDWTCVTDIVNDHPNTDLWYPGALCNRFEGVADPMYAVDISADFNGRIGQPGCLSTQGWYFGLDANGPNDRIDLVTVVLHELSHGLGFLTYAGANGAPLLGTADVFMAYAYDNDQARYWFQMSNSQRGASSQNWEDVVWRGPRTIAAAQSYLTSGTDAMDRPKLYTPVAYEVGSSVSHFTSNADPDLLMEPAITDSLDHTSNGVDMTLAFLQDIGWRDPGCNNGILESAEDCDNGAFNSDTVANACRTSCELPSCGDGVADTGEDCDDGAQNSFDPGHCRPGCVDYLCGDGILDTTEECDDAGGNANTADTCRLNCNNPACGDDIVDTGEECDDGPANGNAPNACRAGCDLPSCGDAVIDNGEECDDGVNNGSGPVQCLPGCVDRCGDGVLDLGEQCDEAGANADVADTCRTNCQEPACGDGIVDSDEQCDDGNVANGDGCTADCQDAIVAEAGSPPAEAGLGGAGGAGGAATAGRGGTAGGAVLPVAGSSSVPEADAATPGPQVVSPGETDAGTGMGNSIPTDSETGIPAATPQGVCGCRAVGSEPAGPGFRFTVALAGLGLLLGRRRKRTL